MTAYPYSDTTNHRSERYNPSELVFGWKQLEAFSVGVYGLFNRHCMYIRYIVSRNLKTLSVPSMHTIAIHTLRTIAPKQGSLLFHYSVVSTQQTHSNSDYIVSRSDAANYAYYMQLHLSPVLYIRITHYFNLTSSVYSVVIIIIFIKWKALGTI